MKIALDFKYHKEDYIKELKQKGFEFDENSFKTIWVYNLNVINYIDLTSRDGFKINIQKEKDFKDISIYLEDLEYFEIHK